MESDIEGLVVFLSYYVRLACPASVANNNWLNDAIIVTDKITDILQTKMKYNTVVIYGK